MADRGFQSNMGISLGRVRVTRAVGSPTEAGYVKSMRDQADAIAKKLENIIKGVQGVTPIAIIDALEPIKDRSLELVPVDTGALKRSFFIETRQTASGSRVVMGYGKAGNPWYAALVHENLFFRHAKGKSAKFLEIAVNENIDKFSGRLRYNMEFGLKKMGNLYG